MSVSGRKQKSCVKNVGNLQQLIKVKSLLHPGDFSSLRAGKKKERKKSAEL